MKYSPDNLVLEVEALTHRLWDPEREEEFIVSVDQPISIPRACFVALLGPSGCGKTSLLTILGLLRKPSNLDDLKSFTMWVEQGSSVSRYDLKEIWQRNHQGTIEYLRRSHIGFALQSGELLPALTVRENIAAPLRLNGIAGSACESRVDELLAAFGLQHEIHNDSSSTSERKEAGKRTLTYSRNSKKKPVKLANSRINKLSGGEYQRVALARAIVHRPSLVYVDEPTANLNRELARGALLELQRMQKDRQTRSTVVMITHDETLASEFADLIIRMEPVPEKAAGRVVEVSPNKPSLHGG